MDRVTSRLMQLAAFTTLVVVIGCAGATTAPVATGKTGLNLNGGAGTPCDSTVVTDGTCRGGYIIPW